MCKRLQDWSLGRLIPTISFNRKYRVHPRAPTTSTSRVSKTFQSVFSNQLKNTVDYLNFEEMKKWEKITKENEQNKILNKLNVNEIEKNMINVNTSIKDNLNNNHNNDYNMNNDTLKNMKHKIVANPNLSSISSNFRSQPTQGASTGSLFNFSNLNNRSKNFVDMNNNIQKSNLTSNQSLSHSIVNNNNSDNNNNYDHKYSNDNDNDNDNSNDNSKNNKNINIDNYSAINSNVDINGFSNKSNINISRNSFSFSQDQLSQIKSIKNPSSNAVKNESKINVSNSIKNLFDKNTSDVSDSKTIIRESIEFDLPCVLAVFDGHHSLEHSIRKLPLPLHPFGVDIVVWLLR